MDDRKGVLPPPPGRGRRRWKRGKAFLRVLGGLLLLLAGLYLFRNPLFSGPLKSFLGNLLSRELHLPVTIHSLSGSWITGIELGGIRSGPPGPGTLFRKLELDRIHLSYAPWDLLLGRPSWIRKVLAQGLVLHLDLDQEKGRPKPPSAPPKALPPFLWKLHPLVDIAIRDFDLRLEGRSLHLEEGRFHLDAGGKGSLEGRGFSLPAPWPEKGPLRLLFSRKGPRIEGISGVAARAHLSGALVDFSRFPPVLAVKGRLRHPLGRIDFLGRIGGDSLSFQVQGKDIGYEAFSFLFPGNLPRPFETLAGLSCRGTLDLERLSRSRGTLSLSLRGTPKDLLLWGDLEGSFQQETLSFRKVLLRGPGLQIQGKGSLSLRGKWRWGMEGKLQGAPGPLKSFPTLPPLAGKGRFSLELSGVGLHPVSGRADLSLARLEVQGLEPIRSLLLKARLEEGDLVEVNRFGADLDQGRLRGRGKIRFDSSGVDWKGQLRGEDLDPSAFLGGQGKGRVSFLFWGRGGENLASLEGSLAFDPAWRSGLPSLQAETALDLSWKNGGILLLRRFQGLLEGHPFQLAMKGPVEKEPGRIRLSSSSLRGPGLDCTLEGTFPPLKEGEAFSLQARILPSRLPPAPLPLLRSVLEIPGFSLGPRAPALQVEGRLTPHRGRLVLRGGEAGAPVLKVQVEEAGPKSSLFTAEGWNLKPAEKVWIQGSLPAWWPSLLAGRTYPFPPGGPIRLMGWAAGLHGPALPGKPFRGEAGVIFLLSGTASSPALSARAWGGNIRIPFPSAGKILPSRKGLEGFADLAWKKGRLSLEGRIAGPYPLECRFRGAGTLPLSFPRALPLPDLEGALAGPFSFQAAFHGNLPPYPSRRPSLPRISGRVRGGVDLKGSLLRPLGRFSLAGENLLVETSGPEGPLHERIRSFSLAGRVEGKELKGNFQAEFRKRETLQVSFLGGFRPRAFFEGGALFPPAGRLEAKGKAQGFRLARVVPLLPFPCTLNGKVTLEGALCGTWEKPDPTGWILLKEGLLKFPSSLPALDGIQGKIRVRPGSLVVQDLQARVAGGSLDFSGTIHSPFTSPRFDLAVKGKDALLYRSRRLRCRADMDLRLLGPLHGLSVEGKVLLASGRYRARLAVLRQGIQAATRAAQDFPSLFQRKGIQLERGRGPLFRLEGPVAGNLRFHLAIGTRDPFQVRTNLFRSDLLVDLKLGGTGRSPLLLGQVTSLEGGKVFLPGATLSIRSLRAFFERSDPYMPHLQVVCEGRRHSVDVQVAAQGPLDRLEVNLSSSPPYSRKALVTLLATGTLPGRQGGGRAALGTLGSYLGGEVLGYLSGGGDESWLEKRLTLEIGTEVGPSGTENILAEFMLTPGVFLQGERDVMGYYNLGLLFRWSLR